MKKHRLARVFAILSELKCVKFLHVNFGFISVRITGIKINALVALLNKRVD